MVGFYVKNIVTGKFGKVVAYSSSFKYGNGIKKNSSKGIEVLYKFEYGRILFGKKKN